MQPVRLHGRIWRRVGLIGPREEERICDRSARPGAPGNHCSVNVISRVPVVPAPAESPAGDDKDV